MRKYFGGLLAVFAIVMLVPGTALATHSNGQGPDKDFQNGAYKTDCPTPFGTFPCHVHIAAQGFSATGTGVPAKGQWWLEIFSGGFAGFPDPVVLSGEVTCFNAIGSSGWVRQRVDQSNVGVVVPGFHTIIGRAIDNGEGSNDPEDESTGFLAGPGTTCPPIGIATTPIDQGNIVIHDGI